MTPKLQPPRAPPDHLRLQSFQILSRLVLIRSFRPWLDFTQHHVHRKQRRPAHAYQVHSPNTPLELLWHCFSFGAPLGTLLSLLGSPAPSRLVHHVEEFDFGIGEEEREVYLESFVGRLEVLELQGRLSYGEVLRVEDFLSGEVSGFAKVLRTVYRLIFALQESYPGIFVPPSNHRQKRREFVQELVNTEQAHLPLFDAVSTAAAALSRGLKKVQPCLECFLVHRKQLTQYHERLLQSLEEVASRGEVEEEEDDDKVPVYWDRVFCLDNDLIRNRISVAYRSICINYLSLVETLEASRLEPGLLDDSRVVQEHLSILISRISEYKNILQDILDCTLPAEDPGYNSLCEAIFRITDISDTMNEVAQQIRTMRATSILKSRAFIWTAPDPDDLGLLLLDDCVVVHPTKGTQYSVFLFERHLLCCAEGRDRLAREVEPAVYPVQPWDLGPALRKSTPLDIVYAIPTARLQMVSLADTTSVEITWVDESEGYRVRGLAFYAMKYKQWDQWISALQPFVPPIYHPSNTPRIMFDHDEVLSEDEDADGNKIVHPKSWSVIARKPARSDTSSFVNVETSDDESLISPGLLPALFSPATSDMVLRSPSPLSAKDAILSFDRPPTPPMDDGFGPSGLSDLTGQIVTEGRYPSAHGGFSDVWKGVWDDGATQRNVAVKVLRSNVDDPEMEEKMVKRLRRELSIWKNLDHPHVLRLYGVASDFGHYSAMVCPWMEHGSVSKHIERCSDIMSTADRLKLLCEAASGLSYLHSRSIVHGDLTGSNILLDDRGSACLCDFGLSTIAAEFQGTAFLTTTVGGAVRWADARFYRVDEEDEEPLTPGKESDVYSFGCVMLEVMSGRIPYHYIRTDAQVVIELHKGVKPRRPAQTFVSDAQWDLIRRCWADDVGLRPGIGEVLKSVEAFYAGCDIDDC